MDRGNAHPYTLTNADDNGYVDTNFYTDSYCYSKLYSYRYGDCHSDHDVGSHSHTHINRHCNAYSYCHA